MRKLSLPAGAAAAVITVLACTGDFYDPYLYITGTEEDALAVYSNGMTTMKCQTLSKVLICHIPPGNPANAHTICVAPSAEDAHLAHGDLSGACEAQGEPEPPPPPPPDAGTGGPIINPE